MYSPPTRWAGENTVDPDEVAVGFWGGIFVGLPIIHCLPQQRVQCLIHDPPTNPSIMSCFPTLCSTYAAE